MPATFDTRAEALADSITTEYVAAFRGFQTFRVELPQVLTLRCQHYDNDLDLVISWIEVDGRWERSAVAHEWDSLALTFETWHVPSTMPLSVLLSADLTIEQFDYPELEEIRNLMDETP